jgi:membrane protease YdiL (CAAX protease family)
MQATVSKSIKASVTFIAITYGLSCIFYYLILHSGTLSGGNGLYVTGIMFCPALSAFITCRIFKKKISGLGWQWGNPRYQLWAYLIPLLYSLVAYLIIWFTGWGGFYNVDFVNGIAKSFGWGNLPHGAVIALFFAFTAVYGIVGSLSRAVGEEIGWRGFLVPELSKSAGYTKTSIIVGLVWAAWHFPILIFGDYNSGGPAWYGLTCFTVMIVSISFVFTWLRLKSNSLWTGALLHASHNLFIQRFFTPITIVNSHTKYFIDEFGAVVPVICLITAIYFWTRRGELTIDPEAS